MDALASFLPPSSGGNLPYWVLFLVVPSIGNCIQNYFTLHYTRRIYNKLFVPNPSLPARGAAYNPDDSTKKFVPASSAASIAPVKSESEFEIPADQITPLAARIFASWTLLASAVRCFAAYNLHVGAMYDLCMLTFVIALAHFGSERFVFRTIGFGAPQAGPLLFPAVSLVWMLLTRSYYVKM